MDEKWHVRGINTLGVKAEFAQGIFYSVQMKQLREDIDREIRKHQLAMAHVRTRATVMADGSTPDRKTIL